ncbi:MAG: phosphate ABC transporter substrate-binding protein PstS family protein [Nitrospina sp.]|jgi:phosphate transport system substrate-binding protein|nr:phosphate ABC transporter substrate-binding protein PstS family protein [Nitrospina sp.]MBT3415683.1 phosphate ABC transporter substrate-binding protein PstS family protein [Nitrospina sp.]MBT3855601.1 phosphate ABC transporter substrate-binding protein PstS family protein [Nitrospina sp.]MBT4104676.1 phosphate ABC transporter substrate-binding protein PstS family protein [Nitrospina sp.]MBT4390085.1 phosphate ABC transporter substrate-binding protein PstS family protein [Nitrospina sp.]
MMKKIGIILLVLVWAGSAFAGPIEVDPELSAYGKQRGISGNLSSVGSDTLNNLMTLWSEKFKQFYPNINIQVEGKGSSTAPPALISATAQLGPMSRAMKQKELDAFESKFGYKPTPVRVAVDALAVFVNKDNPIKGLNLKQVDSLFSKSRRRGHKEVETWGDLGVTGNWASRPISAYGRNSASGTYGFFKKLVMKKGDYKDEVKEQPGSASVVQSVSVDPFSAGYSGIGYKTASVRALPLAETGTNFVEPSAQNALAGEYPLARFLYIYVNKAPGKPLDPLTQEFVKMILSKEGQQVVVKGGYFPIAKAVTDEDIKKITATMTN